MRRIGLLVVGTFLSISSAFAQSKPAIEYEPIISDLNAAVANWGLKEPTYANVATVAAVGCSTARMAIREQYAPRLASYFRGITSPPDTKFDFGAFMGAELKAFRKAGASEAAIGRLEYGFKTRPLATSNTFDEATFSKGLKEFESLSCPARVQPVAALRQPAPQSVSHKGECVINLVLGVSVGVVDAGIGVFGPEVIGPYPAVLLSYFSGSWAWDTLKDGWECK